MTRRLLPSLLLSYALVVVLVGTASAQSVRPEMTLYIQPRIGLTSYYGDQDDNFVPVFGRNTGAPWLAGLEIGYQLNNRFSIGGSYTVSNYPTIQPNINNEYSRRHSAQLLMRYVVGGADARLAPYIQAGLQGTYGETAIEPLTGEFRDELALGPFIDLGLDLVLSDRTSLIFQVGTMFAVPDVAADGVHDEDAASERTGEFDLLSNVSLGLRYSFRSAYTPAQVLAVNCITTVVEDDPATFSAMVAPSTPPVQYSWDFGEGSMGQGMTTTHTFTEPGTYTVNFNATGPRGDVSTQSCAVVVTRRPVPPSIVSINATPMSPTAGQSVNFSSNVQGDEPLSYSWNMGDGSAAHTGASPVHTFNQQGTFTVTLTVSNPHGTDTESMTLTVREAEIALPSELNNVYFNRGSSTLDQEAIDRLAENIELLRQYPEACIQLNGYAAPGESNPDRLTEQRARSAEQYYINNGLAASRLGVMGRGVDPTCNAKEDSRRCRRVESMPMRCTDMMGGRLGTPGPGPTPAPGQDMDEQDTDEGVEEEDEE